ncbi:S8 family peptidase [Salinithrix halophila]|uniref:S8 family peptidase n=1 Tax=Salinithrix halophila TaxID=1485204 RepID=A0ABV8JKQ3_9BACL
MPNRTVAVVSAFCLSAAMITFSSPDTHAKATSSKKVVPGEVVVKYKENVSEKKEASLNGKMNAKVLSSNKQIGFDVVKVEGSIQKAVKKYQDDPNVEYAEPNYVMKAYGEPNDPKFGEQYGPQKLEAPQAWDTTKGKKEVKVAIVDTGVDYNHEDLKGKVEKGGDFIDNDKDPMDEQGHGTHCAGIAAAATDNGKGIAGIAPDVTIYAVRVLDANGSGSNESVAKGITDAADAGANVISLSLGGAEESKVIEDAVNYAHKKGSVIVAAAGNESTDAPSYPAYYEKAIAVAATDGDDKLGEFSNYGDWVDVAAPGVDILSTVPNNGYEKFSGTSMATPHVAGLAGLIASQGKKGDEIRKAIESTSDKTEGAGSKFTHGRVNAAKAIGK